MRKFKCLKLVDENGNKLPEDHPIFNIPETPETKHLVELAAESGKRFKEAFELEK